MDNDKGRTGLYRKLGHRGNLSEINEKNDAHSKLVTQGKKVS
jgi:hypothetical protein